jgi:tryptophanyl-tRNA synthetase
MKTVLTGVKPSGQVHIGNYLGAMKPAIEMCAHADVNGRLFVADYHSLTSVRDPSALSEMIYDLAASWIACGLDPDQTLIYRQSDIPEVFELNWILSCVAPKGLLNRAHAYKAIVEKNEASGNHDQDDGVSMGLFNYPVLQAADILLFSADEVPVGEDQKQHVEIARDIAEKFNRAYGEIIKVPNMDVKKAITITGIDGRKMSKSYDNHLPVLWSQRSCANA